MAETRTLNIKIHTYIKRGGGGVGRGRGVRAEGSRGRSRQEEQRGGLTFHCKVLADASPGQAR